MAALLFWIALVCAYHYLGTMVNAQHTQLDALHIHLVLFCRYNQLESVDSRTPLTLQKYTSSIRFAKESSNNIFNCLMFCYFTLCVAASEFFNLSLILSDSK